ncbi:MAG: NADH-quinone oxidoreductase subunit L [Chloroherpetonaceae bacterium]|nr:NADH-quinone oxidoreductase subunit L [Chthonomonadaceae bacterium]MDW8207837.1 NADH-quinone oxidoreductase subunit L [Chloroherpetonaceae bacterium]
MLQNAWLIVWLPLLGFFFHAISGLIFKDRAAQKRVVAYIAPGVVLAAFLVTCAVLPEVMALPAHRATVPLIPGLGTDAPWIKMGGFQVNFALLLDPLSLLMALIVTGVGGLIHVYATGYMAEDPEQPRFFTYFNLFIFMMLLLVMAENFLLMFVGWEGVGTCSYLLISFWYTQVENAKAGNKAFIVNRVGDLGFALGMMAVWSVFGTLSFFTTDGRGVLDLAAVEGGARDVLGNPVSAGTLTLICMLLFVGAMGKSAQIPLWVWLPDAMAGPTPVSALIHAATMVTAGVVMVTRCSWLFVQAPDAMQLVGWIGIATAFMGATIGLVQNDIKRVLAFSTVSQLGYMFLACGVGNFTAGMFHVTTHAFFKALLFLGSGAVIHSMLGEQDMRRMGGLRKLIPRTWLMMFIGTYAIAGFPLLSGFWSKDEILEAALESPWGSGPLLYGIGLLTAFMTAFYMNRLMWKTFYTEPRFVDGQLVPHHHSNFDAHDGHEEHAHAGGDEHGHAHGSGKVHESPPSMMVPLYVLAVLSVGFGIVMAHFTGGRFEHFLEPSVAPKSLYVSALRHEEGHAPLIPPVVGFVISSVVGIAGLSLAALLYRQKMQTGALLPEAEKARNPVYQFLYNKWWWDALYERIFLQTGGWLADRVLWRLVDAGIVDGIVNGVAGAVGLMARIFRRVQTGYVRNYALVMLLGVVILVGGLLYQWSKEPPLPVRERPSAAGVQ